VPGATVVRGLGARGQLLVTASAEGLASHPAFSRVDPDDELVPLATREPNDTRYVAGQLWALKNIGSAGGVIDADIDAPEAWALTTGSEEVVVAVIDGGVDISHPDLADNIWTNPGEIPGNRIDDDGNGFVDDVHGWDFANRDGTVYDLGDNEHGTHVAGIIAARGDNGRGTVGVSWRARIMPLKFISPTTSFTSDAIAALNYATMMRQRGVNLRVTNNSWGSTVANGSLKAAIDRGGSAGILFVASAGNTGSDDDSAIAPNYPSGYDSACIISVAASDNRDQLWASSNYGRTRVDLAAPGFGIVSTLPADAYGPRTGTSMAAAYVTGVAALAVSVNRDLTVEDLKEALLAGVDPVTGLADRVATGGRLNAERTVRLAASQSPIEAAAGAVVVDDLARIGTKPLVKRGAGAVALTAAGSHSGGTFVEAGELIVRNGGALGTGTVVVKPGARLTLDVGPQPVSCAGLQIQTGGLLDVGTGRIVLGSGTFDLAVIRGQLAAGFAAGTWAGPAGIVSSAAAAMPGRAVGHTLDGAGNLVVGFAGNGDLNVDGVVDFDDVLAFVTAGLFNSGKPASWETGDLDYNGVVDFDDVQALVSAGLYDQGSYLPKASPHAAQSLASVAGPDPMAAAFASLVADQQATADTSPKKKQTTRIG
jgi:autotransporter-associated beta strand protein